ncbi:DNA/RNA non-specific endonuclease [Opitutus sp. ER46]|uniref:DNA/RNA non-specific endonuclease n=1 Tax=Opitutus sp. ER46 TaxID=2161864 RepID=UPI000D31122D|nr:DNA/RNA non-specific endonuclease [Opitutus sp. ER46]PTX92323.1 DNA/RNA non-specific endonuclease [Opitutus sp. ER46]
MNLIQRLFACGFVVLLTACSTVTKSPQPSAPVAASASAIGESRNVLELAVSNATAASERYSVGGLPISKRPAVVLENTGYAVGFSEDLIDPLWAAYYCGPYATFENGKRPNRFSTDDRVCEAAQLKHEDYNRPPGNPTYDRGHMAPNYAIATRYGRTAQLETFKLTNIVPQRSSLNQKTWKALEAEIARNFAPVCKGVWVTVGPIFEEPVTRYNGKAAMPAAFYCIIVDRTDAGKLRALALTMKQSVTGVRRLGDFLTTIRAIEQSTGIDFFAGLPDDVEERLEKAKADADWNWDLKLDPDRYTSE